MDSLQQQRTDTLVETPSGQTQNIIIRGKVVDADEPNEPVIGAKISIEGHTLITLSNAKGEFAFELPKEFLDTTELFLKVSYMRQDTIVQIDSNSVEDLVIPLKIEWFEINGPIQIGIIVGKIAITPQEFDFGTRIKFDRFGRRED